MSSDDSDSDFDKEAEREKLREKYERDQKDRENTQRMSELLLQGATMTGKHCNACGDPIFRYDGQEFCPTCQREVGEAAGRTSEQNAADADQDAAEADRHAGRAARTDASEGEAATDRSADADDEPRVEIDDVRVADRHADPNRRSPPSQQDSGRRDAEKSHARESATRTHDSAPHGRDPSANHDSASNRAARASLVRTLNDLARRAEETDDVARTRELLAATREAAEALAALDRTGR